MTAPISPFDVTDLSNKREIGNQPGTLWSLSSQKPGHGVLQLRDPDLERLWQSDGTGPHRITIDFAKRTAVTHISLWLNVRRDDSYTPTKILVEAGTAYHDLTEVRYREWEAEGEPYEWKHFYLAADPRRPAAEETDSVLAEQGPLQPIHTWMIQISILANHQNGKDTHVRGCLVWGPRETSTSAADAPQGLGNQLDESDDEDDETIAPSSGLPSQIRLQGDHLRNQQLWRNVR